MSSDSLPMPPPPVGDSDTGETDYVHYSHHENNNKVFDGDAISTASDHAGDDTEALPMEDFKGGRPESDSLSSLCINESVLSAPIDQEDVATQITTLTSRESKELRVRFKEDEVDGIMHYIEDDTSNHIGAPDEPLPAAGTSETAFGKLKRALVCYTPDPSEEKIYLKTINKPQGASDNKDTPAAGNYLTALEDLTVAVDIDDEERCRLRETLFFLKAPNEIGNDKRIDYVLAYQDDQENKQVKRKQYEDNLRNEGILIQIDPKERSVDQKTTFVKLHAPIDVLYHNASLMHMRKRLKKEKKLDGEIDCSCLPSSCSVGEGIIPEEEDFFTAPFDLRRGEMFDIDPEDENAFFTSSERSLIAKEVLDRVAYTPDGAPVKKFGITALRSQGVYTAAFPLHEGPLKPVADEREQLDKDYKDRDRMKLYEVWARPARWYCYQPLDLIRKYFGEKIAIYFTWLGFYTGMLIPAAIFGVVAFIYGCATLFDNAPSEEVCNEAGTGGTYMCPQCPQDCPFWNLSQSCLYSRISYVFDNYATVAFSCFMAIWATVFLELWKREQNTLQYDWDVADFELIERMRPEYEFKMKKKKKNPITQVTYINAIGLLTSVRVYTSCIVFHAHNDNCDVLQEEEPYMPWYQRIPRVLTSATVILIMMVLVVGAIIGVIIYRMVIVTVFFVINDPDWVGANAALLTTITAACINFICIMIMSLVYKVVALGLTNLESHRTYTDFEDSFTYKMFLFQFINFYGTIFYIAFFKGRFLSHPGSTEFVFFDGYQQDTCDPAGCLIELTIQLFIIMVGKQAINNFKEVLLPAIKNWCRGKGQRDAETEDNLYMRWEQDNNLQQLDNLALFEEYLEMVIQYGFVTIFVAAFPLAPLFALINNVIEIRLDAYKFLSQLQRQPANRAQDIGAWFDILQSLSFIAVLSNAAIIAWTSEFIPKLVYMYLFSDDGTLVGYVNNSLASFRVGDYPENATPASARNSPNITNETLCGFRAYRFDSDDVNKYEYTTQHWQVLCGRLAFMLVFEHVCFLCTWFISFLIPDVPSRIRTLMVYEKQLVRQLTFEASDKDRQNEKLRPFQTTCQHCGSQK